MSIDPHNVTGGYLARAATGYDEVGRPAVDFSFNSEGAVAFGELTGENTPDPTTGFHRRLAIILDGRLFSAPELGKAITSRGQITGSFKLEEVQFLVEILNAGHLPAALDKTPVSQTSISPQLGADTIRNGSIDDDRCDGADPGVHAGVLPLFGAGGRHGGDAEHVLGRGADDHAERRLHPGWPGGAGADRRHGRRRQRADLRANARRDAARGRTADGDSQRLFSAPCPRSSTATSPRC